MLETNIRIFKRALGGVECTEIPKALVEDLTLSVAARVTLIYMLTKPENWVLDITDLRRVLGKGSGACGRDKAYAVIAELKAARRVCAP